MATQIDLEQMENLKEQIDENGAQLYNELEGLISAMDNTLNVLSGTTFSVVDTLSNTKTQLQKIKDICYWSLYYSSSYLLKKINQYELAGNEAYAKLQEAVDALMGIWDNIDMTTWKEA
jgi:conjugal transfer/entry exclusion protein